MATQDIDGVEFSVDMDTSGAIASTNKIASSTKKIEKSFKGIDTQVTKTSKAVNKGMASMSRSAGQAGVQVEQLIGSINAGQNPLRAFGFQAADLGIVLGFPLAGAIAGVAASMTSVLLPALLKTNEATKDFKFVVADAAKELENLNDLSKAQVSVAISNTKKSMDELSKAAREVEQRVIGMNNQLDSGTKTNVRFSKTGSAIVETVKLTAKETKKLRGELSQEQATLDKIGQQYRKESELLAKLNSNKEGFTKSTEKQKDTVNDVSEALAAQIIALEQGEEAALRYATAQQLGLKVGEQIPENISKQITEVFRLKAAQDEAAEAARKREQDESARKSLSGQVQGLGLSQEDQVTARLNKELELLRLAQEQKIEIEGTYEERRVELRRQAEERIKAINEKATKDSAINFEALENQVIGTFASVASGAQDGKEAVRSLAQSIATQLIGSLIKMGIQAVIGQTTAAATGTATAATLSAAYATPAALASLASFGANAAPAAAGIASTVGLSQGLALAGGREHGGPVTSGSLYEVGEKNKPEMLMIPGNNGKVFSNSEMKSAMSGGGDSQPIQVIINNNAKGVSVSASESVGDDGRMRQIAIQVVEEQSSRVGSNLNQNINRNHNVTNRQGTNRRN